MSDIEKRAIVIDKKDNVATVLENVNKGDIVISKIADEDLRVRSIDHIPKGHKIALKDIKKGEYIIKYGETIGIATVDIEKGQHVHVENVDSIRGKVGQDEL